MDYQKAIRLDYSNYFKLDSTVIRPNPEKVAVFALLRRIPSRLGVVNHVHSVGATDAMAAG